MCWIVLFVLALFVGRRIPIILRTSPNSFLCPDSESFRRWRSLSLAACFVFLSSSIISSIGLIIVAQSVAMQSLSGRISPATQYAALSFMVLLVSGFAVSLGLAIGAFATGRNMMVKGAEVAATVQESVERTPPSEPPVGPTL